MAGTRKIAAILVADIVGYTRLAGTDEDRTLARLRGLRSDLIDPAIAAHHGRIVKRTDLMGDGVNIAARLEGIAKPGAICLSEQTYWQVKGRLDLAVTDLGPTQLKNIAEPIRVYSLDVDRPAHSKPAPAASPEKPAPPRLYGHVQPALELQRVGDLDARRIKCCAVDGPHRVKVSEREHAPAFQAAGRRRRARRICSARRKTGASTIAPSTAAAPRAPRAATPF
jgi:hypothetical protein